MLKAAINALFIMTAPVAQAQNYPRPAEHGAHYKCARKPFGIRSVNGIDSPRPSTTAARQVRVVQSPVRANGAGRIPYRIGLAVQRSIYGESGGCFARSFESSAFQQLTPLVESDTAFAVATCGHFPKRCGVLRDSAAMATSRVRIEVWNSLPFVARR